MLVSSEEVLFGSTCQATRLNLICIGLGLDPASVSIQRLEEGIATLSDQLGNCGRFAGLGQATIADIPCHTTAEHAGDKEDRHGDGRENGDTSAYGRGDPGRRLQKFDKLVRLLFRCDDSHDKSEMDRDDKMGVTCRGKDFP